MVSASLRYARTLLLITLLLICFHGAHAQYIDGTDRHASMICSDGSVYSWGYNLDGILGDGTSELRYTAVQSQTPICTPNPVHDHLTVTIPPGTKQVDVVGLHGQVVATIHPQPYNQAVVFNLGKQADGMYMVVGRTRTNVITRPMIKVK